MIVFLVLSLICFLTSGILFLYMKSQQKKNSLILEKEIKENPEIAILIPARDESRVIEELLISLENQTIKIAPQNIFVIVENEKDKTIEIVKKHRMNFFVRKRLELKSKGYALQELIEELSLRQQFYDCYFIFDADNILEKDFLEKMLEDYRFGYSVSTGYRTLKNKNHFFPVSAGLTFFMINELRNKSSIKSKGNLILSGTGYYIHGRLIKEWKTFPFHSLTEDYESSLYYTLYGISTHYRDDACFYDEQPISYKQSLTQRSRWIKGYFYNWFRYRPKLKKKCKEKINNYGSVVEMYLGILPLLLSILGLLFLFFSLLIFSINYKNGFLLFGYLGILFFIFIFVSLYLLVLLSKKIKLTKKIFFQSLFYHPIFLLSYIPACIHALKKNLGWEKIEHGIKK